MSQIKTLNGIQYTLPQYNDTAWGANTGNVLTQYIAAIADVTLQLTGGAFTLTAETDFGANFGLKALYLKSETANPASAGVVRLAKTDSVKWRNNANGADIALAIDGSDNLQYNATKVLLSGAVVNADINAGAAIAYSKLALTGAILNADLAGSIAYSKLVLTGSVVNGDLAAGTLTNAAINASAAIALSKLAAITASVCPVADASGFLVASSVTATELGYVHGVTSAIQTQLNAAVSNPLAGNLAAGSHKITGLANGTAAADAAAYGQLQTLQAIIQTVKSAAFSTTSNTYQDITGLNASITPTSSSSRVRVRVVGNIYTPNGTVHAILSVKRGVTDLSVNSGGFACVGVASANTSPIKVPISLDYIDSPATTSAVTYTAMMKNTDNASSIIWCNDSEMSTITIEEIR